MKNETLINDVLKELNLVILKFDSYYTLKNTKIKNDIDNKIELDIKNRKDN